MPALTSPLLSYAYGTGDLAADNPYAPKKKSDQDVAPALVDPTKPLSGIGLLGDTTPAYWTPEYGGVPNLPAYTTDTTTGTTTGRDVTTGTTKGTTEVLGTDVQAEITKNLPNYLAMLNQDVQNIHQNLTGQVAPDVIALLQQQAAERGIQTGMPGAGIGNAAYLRALGLTSMQLQQLGNQQLTAAMARTPVQQRQLTTQDLTQQSIADRTAQTTGATTTDLGAQRAVYAAAPDPQAAAEEAMRRYLAGIQAGQSGSTISNRPSTIGGMRRAGWEAYI